MKNPTTVGKTNQLYKTVRPLLHFAMKNFCCLLGLDILDLHVKIAR